MQTIKPMLVSDELRPYFLLLHFRSWMLTAERVLYDTLSSFCREYKGAYWHYYELSNRGIYMAPDLPGTLSLWVAGNGYQGEVSADAAGIISTLFTLNAICYFCGARQSERFSTLHSKLLDYAETHEEAKEIFTAID